MHFVLLLGVFISASFVNGHIPRCSLPNGDEGTCKPIKECDVLIRISRKNQTSEDSAFLARAKCTDGDTEADVCCPNSDTISCITPDYYEGRCVSSQSCPHLMELAKEQRNGSLLMNYKCAGPEDNSVCCGPGEIFTSSSEMECQGNATAFPPDISSGCCGLDETFSNKIIGGNETAIDEYPWMALLEYVKNNNRFLLCGASLISSRYVVTAAHCVRGQILFLGTPKFVRLGEHNVATRGPDCVAADVGDADCNDGAVVAPVERTLAHPRFRPYHADRRHDIALVRLKIIVPYTVFIRPICLPERDYSLSPPEKLSFWVAGWGTYKQDLTADMYYTSNTKQHVQLPFVDKQRCQESVQMLRQSSKAVSLEGQICAGGVRGKDSCNADSGGPLMYEYERLFQIVGIVSFGSKICGLENVPAVYTHVYDYVPWIKKTIKPCICFNFLN